MARIYLFKCDFRQPIFHFFVHEGVFIFIKAKGVMKEQHPYWARLTKYFNTIFNGTTNNQQRYISWPANTLLVCAPPCFYVRIHLYLIIALGLPAQDNNHRRPSARLQRSK
ncbi:hypothetical protein EON65_03800 [archaeon]|nr:MAG: hypothetical protein EON65_03800 [archaeon]